MTAKEYLYSIATLKNVDQVTATIGDDIEGITSRSIISFRKARVNPVKGQCFKANIDKEYAEQHIKKFGKLKLMMKILPNATYDILLIDPNTFNGIRFNEESFEGDKLDYDLSYYNFFDIDISTEELYFRDPEADCKDYTDKEFKDCIEKSAKNDLEYLGCNLPWFTDDESNICRYDTPHISENILSKKYRYIKIINDYAVDRYAAPDRMKCKKPCKSMKIKSKKRTKVMKTKSDKSAIIFLDFNPIVSNTKSILKVSQLDLMVNIGSSLGLWLGLSLFSSFQSILDIDRVLKIGRLGQETFLPIFGVTLFLLVFTLFFFIHF